MTTPTGPVLVVRRKTLMIAGAALGVLLAALTIGFIWLVVTMFEINGERIDDIREIRQPTPAEYRKQIQEGFRRCAREPACVNALRRLLRARPGRAGGSPGNGAEPHRPGRSGSQGSARGGRGDSAPPVRLAPPRRGPSRDPPSSPGGPAPAPAPAPPAPPDRPTPPRPDPPPIPAPPPLPDLPELPCLPLLCSRSDGPIPR